MEKKRNNIKKRGHSLWTTVALFGTLQAGEDKVAASELETRAHINLRVDIWYQIVELQTTNIGDTASLNVSIVIVTKALYRFIHHDKIVL